MVYTLKKYLKELKINPHWEIEPHFHYWCMFKGLEHFETISKNKMNAQDLQSAMYGEFVIAGKPIDKGWIQNLNSMTRFLNKLIEKHKNVKK